MLNTFPCNKEHEARPDDIITCVPVDWVEPRIQSAEHRARGKPVTAERKPKLFKYEEADGFRRLILLKN